MTTRSLFPGVQRLEDLVRDLTVLETPVDLLDLPARMRYWAADHGVETVRDLLRHTPQALQREPPLGPRSIDDTRAELERRLGCTWEIAAALLGASVAMPAAVGEAAFRQRLEALRDTPIETLDLPLRMRRFIRRAGIVTLGELWDTPRERMQGTPNLGQKSIDDTFDLVRAWVMNAPLPPGVMPAPEAQPAAATTFLGAWARGLAALPPIDRLVLQHRTGMLGAVESPATIAAMLGIDAARVLQIEARALDQLAAARTEWSETAARIAAAVPAVARDLAELAGDPWWEGVHRGHEALDRFLGRVAHLDLRVVSFGEQRLLTRLEPARWHELWDHWVATLKALPWPLPVRALRAQLDALAAPLGEGVAAIAWARTTTQLHRDAEGDEHGRALAWGADDEAAVLAALRAAPAPMAVSALHERLGRAVKLPAEVLWFDHGVVGVPAHVPGFATWSATVVPAALAVMHRRPAGAVWLVSEIHEALARPKLIPGWMNAWLLGSILQRSGAVRARGRSKVALAGARSTQRPPKP